MALCDVGHRLKSLRPDLSILVSWGPEITTRPKIEGCDLAVGPRQRIPHPMFACFSITGDLISASGPGAICAVF